MAATDKKPGDKLTPQEVAAFAKAMDRLPNAHLAKALGHFLILHEVAEANVLEMGAIGGQLDIYQRLRALLTLTSAQPRFRQWMADLQFLGQRVEGPLRNKRNRFVHDFWLVEEGSVSRFSHRPRPGAGDKLASIIDETPITLDEVNEVTAELILAGLMLKRIHGEMRSAHEARRQKM
jgi:hypothetical protein